MLDLQSNVAETIVREIALQVTPREAKLLAKGQPVRPEAHIEYLKAQHDNAESSPQAIELSLRHYRRAIELDPTFAPAWVGIANCHNAGSTWPSRRRRGRGMRYLGGVPRSVIRKPTLDFLRQLSRHNDREWFAAHKEEYRLAQENAIEFFDQLIAELNEHDRIETPSGKHSLYRIYNDVRFSRDKTPYNPRFAGHLARTKPMLRGGYYLWIKPGESRLGCGFAYPNPEDLKRIRLDILENHETWQRLLSSRSLEAHFGEMQGDRLATAPRGFPKDHPAIDLLRYKQFWFERPFSDREVLAPDFLAKVNRTYKSIRPFFDYVSQVLTTGKRGGAGPPLHREG